VTLLTAAILCAYAVGLSFYIGNRILAPAFYAMRDTWTPVSTGMVAVGVNIGASLLLMGPLGAVGLALATAVASASNCLQLVLRLRRRIGPLEGRVILRAAGRVAVACLPMAVWGAATHLWWSPMGIPSLVGRVAALIGEMGVAVGLFLAAAALLRCDELAWAQDLLRRRMRRSSARPVRG
jgi:putative peptidoglycan lipid II flippase